MRIGKLDNSKLQSLVLDNFRSVRPESGSPPSIGMDCAVLNLFHDPEKTVVLSTDPITAAENRLGFLTVHINCNDAAAAGAEPIALLTTLLAPPDITEERLSSIAKDLASAAYNANVDIVGGHTEVTSAVNRVVSSAAVIARPVNGKVIPSGGMRPGDAIIMTKSAGLEGTAVLAMDRADSLSLDSHDLSRAQDFINMISVVPEGILSAKNGAHAMHDVTEGGVLGALWEMAYASGLGITVDISKIPVHPLTQRICETLKLNPYRLLSSGALLIACPDGDKMLSVLTANNINAQIIAYASARPGLFDIGGQELSPPASDELYNV